MTTARLDEEDTNIKVKPGAQLAAVRLANGYSIEEIAGKLNLRVRIIELLEADNYDSMPDAVFVKGYLRAYAKLMDLNGNALIEVYNQHYSADQQPEKALLWQSKRDTSRGERAIRWMTTLFGMVVLISVAIWWQKSKENQSLFAKTTAEAQKAQPENEYAQADIRLTDLSTMRSLLSSVTPFDPAEKKGE
jgi:cytoskeleton protein RodZ